MTSQKLPKRRELKDERTLTTDQPLIYFDLQLENEPNIQNY